MATGLEMSKGGTIEIRPVASQDVPLRLLLDADPDECRVRDYLRDAECYATVANGVIVGVCVVRRHDEDTFELMNVAVDSGWRRRGIGSRLLAHAVGVARQQGGRQFIVGTGAFGYQLAFYQKAGFRVLRIERDFFLRNYSEPVMEDGIRHKDMIVLELGLENNTAAVSS